MGFSAVMVVSGEADPSHLSAGSPSTGQPAYSEKALMRRLQTFLGGMPAGRDRPKAATPQPPACGRKWHRARPARTDVVQARSSSAVIGGLQSPLACVEDN